MFSLLIQRTIFNVEATEISSSIKFKTDLFNNKINWGQLVIVYNDHSCSVSEFNTNKSEKPPGIWMDHLTFFNNPIDDILFFIMGSID